MPETFVRQKILSPLIGTKSEEIKINYPQFLWLSLDLECPTGFYNVYIRNPRQEVGRYQIFCGLYSTIDSIVTPSGKMYEGNKRVLHYEEVMGNSFLNKIIHLIAKWKLSAGVKRNIQLVEAELARKKGSETTENQLSKNFSKKNCLQ